MNKIGATPAEALILANQVAILAAIKVLLDGQASQLMGRAVEPRHFNEIGRALGYIDLAIDDAKEAIAK